LNKENSQLKEQLEETKQTGLDAIKIAEDLSANLKKYEARVEQLQEQLAAKEKELSEYKLTILNEVKFGFEIHSDSSSMCNGYKALCRQIQELTPPSKR